MNITQNGLCAYSKVVIYGNGGWKCIQETMLLFILLEMETCQLT